MRYRILYNYICNGNLPLFINYLLLFTSSFFWIFYYSFIYHNLILIILTSLASSFDIFFFLFVVIYPPNDGQIGILSITKFSINTLTFIYMIFIFFASQQYTFLGLFIITNIIYILTLFNIIKIHSRRDVLPIFITYPPNENIIINNIYNQSECSICLDTLNYNNPRTMVQLECNHVYHLLCYNQQLNNSVFICAICRRPTMQR
jgi:hypothetical protein